MDIAKTGASRGPRHQSHNASYDGLRKRQEEAALHPDPLPGTLGTWETGKRRSSETVSIGKQGRTTTQMCLEAQIAQHIPDREHEHHTDRVLVTCFPVGE